MVFGRVVLQTTTAILRSIPILTVALVDLGGHFELCPLLNLILTIVVAVLTSTA